MEFGESDKYTLGVEIELQTLDQSSWQLAPLAPQLLESAPAILRRRLSPEFIQSILEIQTDICFSIEDVENDLMQTMSMAEELAEYHDCRLFSASLHPFANHKHQILTTSERYERIMAELQIVGRRFISQGFHVHVGVSGGDTAIKVCNQIQAYLPVLLVLTCSSPYSGGSDTGLMSYRTKLFEALPLAGLYTYFEDWDGLVAEVEGIQRSGIVKGLKDLWWDCRPNPSYGTVEVRICDLPIRFSDILAITTLIQALVATIAENDLVSQRLNPYMLQANKWQAARYGLDGMFVDPSGLLGTERIPYREAVSELRKMVDPMTRRLGSYPYIGGLDRIVERGTGSDFLRERYAATGDFTKVIESLQGEFWE